MQTVVVETLHPFLVIIVMNPTQKEVFEQGKVPQIIVQPQAVLAKDETQAAAKAMRFVPEEYSGSLDRVEPHVLPFSRARS